MQRKKWKRGSRYNEKEDVKKKDDVINWMVQNNRI